MSNSLKKQRKCNLYEGADKHGNRVKIEQKAEAMADYLDTVQWNNPIDREAAEQEYTHLQNRPTAINPENETLNNTFSTNKVLT